MQTFVPYPHLALSAATLDHARLGKQRVETLQVLRTLLLPPTPKRGWQRHPAKVMWEGHHLALLAYQEAICREWVAVRGHADSCWPKSLALFSEEELLRFAAGDYSFPNWWGREKLHLSHRSNLLRKAPTFYWHRFEDSLPDDLPYLWPGASHTA
jgi:hypothetical protein